MLYAYSIDLLARENEAQFLKNIDIPSLSNVTNGALPRLGWRFFNEIGNTFIAAGKLLKALLR